MRKLFFILILFILCFSSIAYAAVPIVVTDPATSIEETTAMLHGNQTGADDSIGFEYSTDTSYSNSITVLSSENWTSNATIISGLGDVGADSTATVFNMSGTWYLISGINTGAFAGRRWNGATWVSNATIISGLTDVGTDSTATVFNMSGTWYLIAGETDGVFNGWRWNGATWVSNATIISGLTDVGTESTPCVFSMNSIYYLISGENDGVFNGWHKFLINNFSYNLGGLSPGTLYHYRAFAINGDGTGYGADATFITKPIEPTSFKASKTTTPSVVLSWTKGEGANNTYIMRKVGSYPVDRTDGTNIYNGTASSYTDTTIVSGGNYFYKAWSYTQWGTEHQWSDLNDTTSAYIGSNYTIELRFEQNGTLINASHYDLILTIYAGTAVYYNTSIISNTFNISIPSIVESLRITVNSTYYRSRIPTEQNGTIIFYICKNVTNVERYLFSLDDQSGLYAPPDAYLQIYTYYNETQQIIHEEYFAADLGVAAYLRYIPPYTRYYAQVISGSNTYGPLVINTNTTTTQSIVVYPEGLSDQYIFSNYITFTGYISGTSLYANYTDSLSGTNAVNLTFIEWYNNSETIIGYYNTTSDDFQKYFSINTSRTHFIDITINHDELGNLTARLYFYHSPTQITNQTSIEDKLTAVFGDNPLGWGNMIAFVLSIIVLMTFGEADAGLGILGMAMTLGFLNIFLGFSVIVIGICGLLGMMGVLVLVRDKGGLT